MKLLRTDISFKARFRVVLMLFVFARGGLSLPQHTKTKVQTKSQELDVHEHQMTQPINVDNNAAMLVDLKDKTSTTYLQHELENNSALTRVKRKIGTDSVHLDRRKISRPESENYGSRNDGNPQSYLIKSEVIETKKKIASDISDSQRSPISSSGRKESYANSYPQEHLEGHEAVLPQKPSNLLIEGKSNQEVSSERFSIDSILNDMHIGKGSDSVIDYYFVDDTLLRDDQKQHQVHQGSSVRHGVIINLTGLIPNGMEEEEEDEEPSDRTAVISAKHNGGHDEILAFKAFEIRPNAEIVRLPAIMADSEDQLTGDEPTGSSIDYYADQHLASHHSRSFPSHKTEEEEDYETPVSPTSGENRNLSRKRRQKALPDSDDADRHRRHHIGRKRRRKRKRRHRNLAASRVTSRASSSSGDESGSHSKTAEVVPETLSTMVAAGQNHRRHQQERFLLKSNSPAYVITSASEVKKDWCKTVPFKQKVVEKNCKARFITNNFCYGQCNSFFIPHVGKGTANGGAAFQSCALCKPHKFKWITVTLSCPRQEQQRIEKRVLIVESCRCKTVTLQ